MREKLEPIKQRIAEGECAEAIELLNALPETAARGMRDELLLLQYRLGRLEQAVANGTIARDDEMVERNGIIRSLLDLVVALETGDTESYAEPPRPDEPAPPRRPESARGAMPRRPLLIGLTLLGLLALLWVLGARINTGKAPELSDLTVQLVFRPENPMPRQTGLARVYLGAAVSEALPIPSDGMLRLRNMPAPGPGRPARLELSDTKYACRVAGQSAPAPDSLIFIVELEQQTFSGQVIHRDGRPAPGVEIEIENGLARAVSDAAGRYTFSLPKWDADNVRLVLRRQGKVLADRKIGLQQTVLQELKIPD